MSKIIINLDEDIILDKDAIIEASAGTGKTYTIKEIVKLLISKERAKPEEIVVLTFTEKATRELKERIRKTINDDSEKDNLLKKASMNFENFNIFTIHGFCNNIIKNYPFDIKIPINAELSVVPTDILLTNILLKELPFFLKFFDEIETEEIEKMKANILALRNYICFEKGHIIKCEFVEKEFHSSREVKEYIETEFKEKDKAKLISLMKNYFVLRLFEEEEEYKKKNWIITYDDMITKVWEGLNINEKFRLKISSLYKYIIIDEFQDTDLLQWKIFKTMKDNNPDLKLILVGDPKQAIYSFRGGDIHTYFHAIEEINPEKYILNINYRTSKEIVDKLNKLFSASIEKENLSWFSNSQFDYKPVQASVEVPENFKNLSPFNAYLIDAEKPKDAYELWKNFTISEIIRLLNQGIKKSDILILCRTTSNAREYESELLKNKVKAFFYDREGALFETKEALNLKTLLCALSFPEDLGLKKTLLVSEIFGLSFAEVNSFIESKEAENFNTLFAKWVELSKEKKWQELFDSVFFDTCMFENLYKKYSTSIARDAFNKYLQLSSIIKDTAEQKNMNTFSLFTEFDRMLREENAKTMLLDDEDFVKIMTIHASKGLEAPIVFLGDGFTTKANYDFYKYYDKEKKQYYFIIKDTGSDESKEKHKAESDAEDERLFYVALTRAKYALYFGLSNVNKKQGAYVLCDWIKDLATTAQITKKLPAVNQEKYEENENNVEIKKEFMGEIDFSRHSFMASFSSIKRKLENNEIITEVELSVEDEDDKNIVDNKLPTGKLFGTLIHEIMEELDFQIVKDVNSPEELYNFENFKDFIEKKVEKFYKKEISFPITELVFFALKNKLSDFSLCEIEPEKKKSELSFYLKISDKFYLTGAIDLIFEHKDKFYIVDWKTNLLETYEGDNFIEKVENSYGLQYRIYTLAVMEYLKNFYTEPEKKFGGIFYIYLKGLKKDSNAGIFYKNQINLKEFKEYVLEEYIKVTGK